MLHRHFSPGTTSVHYKLATGKIDGSEFFFSSSSRLSVSSTSDSRTLLSNFWDEPGNWKVWDKTSLRVWRPCHSGSRVMTNPAAQAHANVQTTHSRKNGLLKMYLDPYKGIGRTMMKANVTAYNPLRALNMYLQQRNSR